MVIFDSFFILLVAGGFAPKGVHTHQISSHIDLTSDQLLRNIFLVWPKKRLHYGHNETKSHKTCLFLILKSVEGEGKLKIESL